DHLDEVDHVVYVLPDTFPNPVRTKKDRASGFRMSKEGPGRFTLHARVVRKNEQVVVLHREMALEVTAGTADQPCPAAPPATPARPATRPRRPPPVPAPTRPRLRPKPGDPAGPGRRQPGHAPGALGGSGSGSDARVRSGSNGDRNRSDGG